MNLGVIELLKPFLFIRFTQEHLDMIEAGLSLCGSMLYKDMVVERERTLRQQTEVNFLSYSHTSGQS